VSEFSSVLTYWTSLGSTCSAAWSNRFS